MASLADMFVQGQIEATDPSKGPDLAGNYAKGAELAYHAEGLKQQQQQIEIQKDQLQQAKLDKFVTAVEKGQQYTGKAQSNYYNKFLPAYKKTLGSDIDQMIPDDALAFMTASPENIGKFHTLVADVKDGHITAQKAIETLNDPIQFANVTPDMFKAIDESQKTFLGNQTQIAKTEATIGGAAARQSTEISSAGEVEVKKKTGEEFTKYKAVGGSAALDKTEEALKDAIKQLKSGKVKTGGLVENLPYGGETAVLARINKPLKALQDKVLSTQNIKALSGDPNPTERQIKDINSRILDPAADNDTNIAKLKAELTRVQTERANKESEFIKQGLMQAKKTYTIGGQPRTAAEAKAFYTAHPQFLKGKDALKKELGL